MRSIEWHPKDNWRVLERLEKVIPIPRSLTMVAERKQFSHRPTTTPDKTCSANLYRRIKRRVGRPVKQAHFKRNLVPPREQASYKLLELKISVSSLKGISGPLFRQDSSCGNRQHHSGVIHKQGRRHEVGPTLCPVMKNLDLMYHSE